MGSPERFDRADANGPGQKPDDGHERGKQKGGAIRPRRVDDQASHDRRYNPRDVAEAVCSPIHFAVADGPARVWPIANRLKPRVRGRWTTTAARQQRRPDHGRRTSACRWWRPGRRLPCRSCEQRSGSVHSPSVGRPPPAPSSACYRVVTRQASGQGRNRMNVRTMLPPLSRRVGCS